MQLQHTDPEASRGSEELCPADIGELEELHMQQKMQVERMRRDMLDSFQGLEVGPVNV